MEKIPNHATDETDEDLFPRVFLNPENILTKEKEDWKWSFVGRLCSNILYDSNRVYNFINNNWDLKSTAEVVQFNRRSNFFIITLTSIDDFNLLREGGTRGIFGKLIVLVGIPTSGPEFINEEEYYKIMIWALIKKNPKAH